MLVATVLIGSAILWIFNVRDHGSLDLHPASVMLAVVAGAVFAVFASPFVVIVTGLSFPIAYAISTAVIALALLPFGVFK